MMNSVFNSFIYLIYNPHTNPTATNVQKEIKTLVNYLSSLRSQNAFQNSTSGLPDNEIFFFSFILFTGLIASRKYSSVFLSYKLIHWTFLRLNPTRRKVDQRQDVLGDVVE